MQENTITNEMIYDLLKEFKRDVYQRFEQTDKRFEQIEDHQSEDHKLLIDLWENRDKSTLNFSSIYFLITLISSILAAIATTSILN